MDNPEILHHTNLPPAAGLEFLVEPPIYHERRSWRFYAKPTGMRKKYQVFQH